MRVLQLGPYPPPHGGVQTHIASLVDFLRERGVACEVVNLTRFRRPSSDGIFYPSSAFAVLQHLLTHRYDIIHLHIGGLIWRRQLGLALACSWLPGTRTVFTFHSGGYPSSPEGRSVHAGTLRGFVFRRFDQLIAVNDEIAQFFRKLGVPAERIHVISPYFPSVGNSRAGDSPRQGSLPDHVSKFLASHHPALISVGLSEPEYDLPLQMEALGAVRKEHPDTGLLIVGSGSLDEPLRKQASQFPYAEHILLSGDVEHAYTLEAIRRSDLMLRTTWYDGDALSVREALDLGTPVIATDNGMRPEGVSLIPARNIDALVVAIKETLSRPRQVKSPGPSTSAGQSARNLEEILDLYRQLAPRSDR